MSTNPSLQIAKESGVHFLKTFLLHFFLLSLFSFLFRVFFAFKLGWFNVENLMTAIPFGLRFDFAIASALALLFTILVFIFEKPKIFVIPYVLLMVCLFSDLLYFQESSRHLSYEIWDFFTSLSELSTYIVNYWISFLVIAIVTGILSFLAQRLCFFDSRPSHKKTISSIFISSLLTLICVRGGVVGISQNPALSYKAGDHKQAQIALNGAYAMFYSLLTGRHLKPEDIVLPAELKTKNTIEAQLEKLYASVHFQKGIPKKYNIVIVFLEGWPAEYLQSYGAADNVTPAFEDIRKKSITTTETIAGGKRTTEGMFATLCSYQNPLGKTIMFSHLESQKYNCLPDILKQRGWFTAYLQGTNNMTSGVGAFTYKVGFTLTGGKKEYPQYETVEKNSWGLFDKELYQWVLAEMNKAPQPFLFSIGTNTTHDLLLKKGEKYEFGDDTIQNKTKSVLFSADRDLGEFIKNVEAQKWEYPVLYVLVSDHSSHVTSSSYNSFRVPFAIYSKDLEPKKYDFAISQRDIAPTILDLLGIENQSLTGVSLFSKTPYRFAEYYTSPHLGIVVNESFVEWSLKDPQEKKCYKWRTDFKLTSPLDCSDIDLANGFMGLSFTKYSQDLLFKNRAKDFFDFKK